MDVEIKRKQDIEKILNKFMFISFRTRFDGGQILYGATQKDNNQNKDTIVELEQRVVTFGKNEPKPTENITRQQLIDLIYKNRKQIHVINY